MDRNNLLEELITMSNEIIESLINLNNYCENLQSKTIKEITSQNLSLGFNSFLRLTDAVQLYAEYLKHNMDEYNKYLANVHNYGESMKDSINEITDANLKKICATNVYNHLTSIQQQNEMLFTVSELNRLFLESSILLVAYNIYYSLNVVDNKFKNHNIKKRIKELVENVLSFTPAGSINDLIKFFTSSLELINAFEDKNASEESVYSADDTIALLERQSELLQHSALSALLLLDDLKSVNNVDSNIAEN